MKKVQELPARLISSELNAHQCHLAGLLRTGGVVPHSSSWTASAYELQNRQMPGKFIAEATAQGGDSPRMAFLIVTEARLSTIPDFSGFSRDGGVQKTPR